MTTELPDRNFYLTDIVVDGIVAAHRLSYDMTPAEWDTFVKETGFDSKTMQLHLKLGVRPRG